MLREIQLLRHGVRQVNAATVHRSGKLVREVLAFHRFGPLLFVLVASPVSGFACAQYREVILAHGAFLHRGVIGPHIPWRTPDQMLTGYFSDMKSGAFVLHKTHG